LVPWGVIVSTVTGEAGPRRPGTHRERRNHVKKDKEDRKRCLILNRETIQRLEDPRLLEQVRGGTSQWGCLTTRTNFNAVATDGC
jgi:hypothetical protein